VHIGWALLVALVLVEVSRSRWRWLALAYPALTMLAVVVTANHYWLDGLAAALLLALALVVQRAARAAALPARIRRAARRAGPARKPAMGWRVLAIGKRWPDREETG
jgi:MFS superfamily sulfate permease-like transporter